MRQQTTKRESEMGKVSTTRGKGFGASKPMQTSREIADRVEGSFFKAFKYFSAKEKNCVLTRMKEMYAVAEKEYKMPCLLIDTSFEIYPGSLEKFTVINSEIEQAWHFKAKNKFFIAFHSKPIITGREPQEGSKTGVKIISTSYSKFI